MHVVWDGFVYEQFKPKIFLYDSEILGMEEKTVGHISFAAHMYEQHQSVNF